MNGEALPAEEVEAIWAELRRLRGVAGAAPSVTLDAVAGSEDALRLLNAALAMSEAHHRAIVESATDFAIVATDRDGCVTTWNEGARRLLGWSEDEMLGGNVSVIFTPEDRASGAPEREMSGALENGRALDERWHLRRDGSRFWASGLLMPLRIEGRTVGFLKIMRDLTDEHLRDERARRVEERLRLTLAATPAVGIWDWDVTADRVHADANFAAAYGVSVQEAAGGAPLATFTRNIHADDLRSMSEALEATRATGVPFSSEYRLHQPDGSLRWVLAQGGLSVAENGLDVRLSGISLDITERKAAELRQAALIELGDRFRDVDDPDEITAIAAEVLGRTLGASRAGYGTVEDGGDLVRIDRDWTSKDQRSVAGRHRLADFGTFGVDLAAGRMVVVDDVLADPRTAGRPDRWRSIDVRALTNAPVMEHDRCVAVLFLHQDRMRKWSPEEIRFIRDVGQRTREAVERRRAEEAQRLLTGEFQHRVKNTLAMVQAIANQTFREVASVGARDVFASRMVALAQANDVLSSSREGAAPIRDVVTGATVPHCAGPERFTVSGPDLEVVGQAALALTLALHELCTNAAKYGALSSEEGHVAIEWGVERQTTLRLRWRERGGPRVQVPERTGFGTQLLRRSLSGPLRGRVDTAFDPEGVTCTIDLPVDAVRGAA